MWSRGRNEPFDRLGLKQRDISFFGLSDFLGIPFHANATSRKFGLMLLTVGTQSYPILDKS
jgi:hypothetical protein